jgi:hypothetical protein
VKKISQIIIGIAMAVSVSAQTNTTLNVLTNPTATLSDWANQNAIVNFIVTNGDTTRSVIFKTEILLLDGTVVATTDVTKATAVTLTRGTRVFFSKDVLPLEIMQFTGQYKTILQRTGKLPAGNYQLSVQLLQPTTYAPIVAARVRSFNVVALQLPILIMPANNDSLNRLVAQTAITFRWTPLIPRTQSLPSYRLQVFEVLANQQPIQALRSNQPILDITVKSITQYIWQPRMAFNAAEAQPLKFVWTLQTLDDRGLPAVQTDGNGESRSEPFVFTLR